MNVDLEKNKIFKKLAQRKKVGWSMSFDNVGDRFEYVRYGGSWQTLQNNLSVVKDLMKNNGHWGGIHAVYNIYNATRLRELKEFATETNTSILWQNLFQPKHLDPFLHSGKVAELAAEEIQYLYDNNLVTDTERGFFDQALKTYEERMDITKVSDVDIAFWKHIYDIEHKYHLDKAGQFVKLWPELEFLCK
jgi:hypothetical protein